MVYNGENAEFPRKERPMQAQNILFDLDGTLTDSAPGVTNAFSYALAAYGIHADPADLTMVVGPPLHESFIRFFGFSESEAFRAVDKYREYYRDIGIFENRVYDGIPELLTGLTEAGKTLLVASSKPLIFVERVLDHYGIRKPFTHICGSEPDGRRTDKAEVVQWALSLCGGNGENSVLVGDRSFDVDGGHALGIPVIGALWGYGDRTELSDADALAGTPADVQQLILGKQGRKSPAF